MIETNGQNQSPTMMGAGAYAMKALWEFFKVWILIIFIAFASGVVISFLVEMFLMGWRLF